LPDNGLAKIVNKIRGNKEVEKNSFTKEQYKVFTEDWVKKFEDKAGKDIIDEFWKNRGDDGMDIAKKIFIRVDRQRKTG
jgi:hypothetical protein